MFFAEKERYLRLLYKERNPLLGGGLSVVISQLTVYTQRPTARGLEARILVVGTPLVRGT